MDRRIEIVFPVEDATARDRLLYEILEGYWKDTENSWILQADGTYERRPSSTLVWDCHQKFIEIARQQGIKSLPYDKAIRHNMKGQGRPIVKKSKKASAPSPKDSKNN
jgi:polyphosphate kinase